VKITALEVDHTPVKPAFGFRIDYSVVREESGSSDVLNRDGLDEGSDDDTQEFGEPSQEQAEDTMG
jgi:hypothetical protein